MRTWAPGCPLFTNNVEDFHGSPTYVRQCVDGVDAKIAWHFCYGNAWGNRLAGLFPTGYESVLRYFYDLPIDQFVLDFANRDMVDLDALIVAAVRQRGSYWRDRRAHHHDRVTAAGRRSASAGSSQLFLRNACT